MIGVFRVGVVRDGMAFARSNLRPQRPSCRGAPALYLVNAVVAAFSIALLLEGGFRGLMPVIVRACSRTHCPYLHVYQQPRHRVETFHSSFPHLHTYEQPRHRVETANSRIHQLWAQTRHCAIRRCAWKSNGCLGSTVNRAPGQTVYKFVISPILPSFFLSC